MLCLLLTSPGTPATAGPRPPQRDRILLVAGGPSHGYGEHEYRAGARLARAALEEAGVGLEVVVHEAWPPEPELERAAALVLSMDGRGAHLALPHLAQIDRHVARGMGVMALHWAVHVPRGEAGEAFERWIGGYYETGHSTNPKWTARLAVDAGHPIGRGVGEVEIHDEWYFNIRFREQGVTPIATAVPTDEDRSRVSSFWPWASPPAAIERMSGRRETLVWAIERPDGGRGVGFTGGHFHWNLGNDAYRRLLLNAVLWVAGGEVPAGGVDSATPGFGELRAGQDESEPLWFDAHGVRERFGLRADAVAPIDHVPVERFALPEDLEISLWAKSPQLYNPSNIDVDADGRVWVAESWNYRGWPGERQQGDRIVVLEDTDGDGRADSSHVFVQEPALAAPLGIAVIGNRILVSQAPHLIEYVDVDRDLRFDPEVDERRHLLSGFGGADSDHALHSVVVGPDGYWYGSFGNDGAALRLRDGRRFHFKGRTSGPQPPAERSDDGHVYVGGAAYRMRPDTSGFEVIGHNFRNAYELAVTSRGDVFQNDNDDGQACRTTWLMEYANLGYRSPDGTRTWFLDRRPGQSIGSAHWRQLDPGVLPAGDIYGAGAPTGIVFNEGDGLGPRYRGLLISADSALETLLAYRPRPQGAGFALERFDLLTANPRRELSGTDTSRGAPMTGIAGWFARQAGESRARGHGPAWFETLFREIGLDRAYIAPSDPEAPPHGRFRPSDVAIGTDGALYIADWFDAVVGGNTMTDLERRGAIYRVTRRGDRPPAPALDVSTIPGAIEALRSPAVNVRALGFEALRARGHEALQAVEALLDDPDEYVRARAVWLLPHLGEQGAHTAYRLAGLEVPGNEELALPAFRALRRAGRRTTHIARSLASDRDRGPAMRREAVLSMRDEPWEVLESWEVLDDFARAGLEDDPWLLEALGIGATGKEEQLHARLRAGDLPALRPLDWERILWRLHPPGAVPELRARALDAERSAASRGLAIDALAFIDDPAAAAALQAVAATTDEADEALALRAAWWLERNADSTWHAYATAHDRPRQYDPQLFVDFRALADSEREARTELPPAAEILALPADAERGRELFTSGRAPCSACHVSDGIGGSIGPDLSRVEERLTRREIVTRMLRPTSELMPPASALRLAAQDVADLARYLSSR